MKRMNKSYVELFERTLKLFERTLKLFERTVSYCVSQSLQVFWLNIKLKFSKVNLKIVGTKEKDLSSLFFIFYRNTGWFQKHIDNLLRVQNFYFNKNNGFYLLL